MTGFARTVWSFFDLNGTASRKRGWIVFGVTLVILVGGQVLAMINPAALRPFLLPVVFASLALTVVLVQRLHDAGRSGYWALLTLIPLLGLIVAIVILCLRPAATPPNAHVIARRVGTGAMGLVLVVALTRTLGLWQPFFIPAESMKPTLLIGDFLIATPISRPQRGDVLVFRHPTNGSDYIKRLIGLPGDKVQMQNGVVMLNGAALPQTPDGTFEEVFAPQGSSGNLPRCANAPVGIGATCIRDRLTEVLPDGQSHDILNLDDSAFPDNTDVYTVPEGMYFFLGDNRDNSFDSRFAQNIGGLGMVAMGNVIGKARVIVFSSAGASLADIASWRSDRYWKAIE